MNNNESSKNRSSDSQFLKKNSEIAKSNSIDIPSISLPKGGGAIKSIDEKFSVNAINGSASLSFFLPFSPARGASPSINLSYNSGSGNGIFGLGWNINLASIKRKTDKGLPKYFDTIGSDIFLYSEAEDLVPEFKKEPDGSYSIDSNGDFVYYEKDSPDGLDTIRYYKPRIEGSFSCIERWTNKSTGVIKWRIISKENVTTLFGWTDNSIIVDPKDGKKIFEWVPEFVFDDKGNCSQFIYRKEDEKGVNAFLLHNKNRLEGGKITYTNLYLEKVIYGNITPFEKFGNPLPVETDYLFQTIFDYGEYDTNSPYLKIRDWDFRTDAFSDYKAGFEIRTTRLCKRVLLFHHFKDSNEYDGLVKSVNFEYDTSSERDFTFLKSITPFGYLKQADGTYIQKNLPAAEFEYQKHEWNKEIKSISAENLVHAPSGFDEYYQFTDLFNEGLSGILTEQATGWYYKHNLGDGKFEQAKLISPKPSFAGLGKQMQLADLDADGGKQLVSYGTKPTGYFELDDDNEWQQFQVFQNFPNIDFSDTNTRMLDLDGDGKPEILISEDHIFTWYESEGRNGFSEAYKTIKPFDEETGPNVIFADQKQTVFLADFSGDGLTDIGRIRNGEVCYWPNLGYGRFGAKIAMDNAPLFDNPDSFNPAFLRLADIDGSGTTDIIYLGKNKFTCWLNLSGNSFSKIPFEIEAFPDVHNHAKIIVTDLLGNGIACIVWSSSLSKDALCPLRYVDLMNSKKPHIMVSYKNNLGKEVSIEYTPSTKFYIEDKLAGTPWVTKLHFPVHCISKTETVDIVSGLRFVSKYKYHHGYYDHEEREFRGFGMVEQTDTEEFEYLKNANAANATDIQFHEPPVLTKTWFHTGAYLRNNKILDHYKHEYWYNDPYLVALYGDMSAKEPGLPDALFFGSLNTKELVEAHRACKGMALRQEIFALDGSDKEKIPYSVVTHNCYIKLLQPKSKNRFAIFLVHESEAITFSYERNVNDPRIAHTLNLEIDDLGNILKEVAVAYPRKIRPAVLTENKIWNEQNLLHIMLTEANFTKDINTPAAYRLRLPYQTKTYKLQVKKKLTGNALFTIDDLNIIAAELPYETIFTPNTDEKRLIEHVKTTYLKNDLRTPAAEGEHDTLGFGYESYQLAFTNSLLDTIYKKPAEPSKINPSMLTEGKYIDLKNDGHWWVRSGTVQYLNTFTGETSADAAKRFFLPLSYIDPFGSVTSVNYYKNYYLFIQQTKDALDNVIQVEKFDFRTLSPKLIKDANANLTELAIDTLGLVVGTAIIGKGTEADDLINFNPDISSTQVQDFFTDPFTNGKNLLQNATSRLVYDFTKIPCSIGTIVREEHHNINTDSKLQFSFEYSGGFGNVVLKKIQAEPGDAPHRDSQGKLVKKPNGELDLQPTLHRWVGNGRTILNNKGRPVKQYEPYFCDSQLFEDESELRESGVTRILYYDAAGRLVKTTMPDDTFSSIEYDSWIQRSFDQNDNCIKSKWYTDRINRLIDAILIQQGRDPVKEKEAAQKTAIHDNTPSVIHTDSLGRPFYTISHNKFTDFASSTIIEEFYATQSILDIEGNLLSVVDARNNIVMQYKYDMLGNILYSSSMDAGERWLLNDCMGKPVFAWDSKDHQFETTYDNLHRPLEQTVTKISTAATTIFEKSEYVDTKGLTFAQLAMQQAQNLVGKQIAHYDSAGIERLSLCDFKGNTLEGSRQLCKVYKNIPDWKNPVSVVMESEIFISKSEFDSLNRPVKLFSPSTPVVPASVISREYNEANMLNAISARLRGSSTDTYFVRDIEYDTKGQRISILYNNNTVTKYTYDPKTFRLIRLITTRKTGADVLQDLKYTYDPIGNITYIKDDAMETIFFNNKQVDPDCDYIYDSTYRLIQATGREYIDNNSAPDAYDAQRTNIFYKGAGNALQTYTQRYGYDAVGNMQYMRNVNNWSRNFTYNTTNNQLLTSPSNNELGTPFMYEYDMHGNMIKMPHLPLMYWNFKDQLQHIDINKTSENDLASGVDYVYNASGERIRKVVEKNNITEERIYLGGFEIFRKVRNGTTEIERESLHIKDDTKRIVLIETQIKPNHEAETPLIRYQYGNHLGTASLELDGSNDALIISYEEYYPFGSTSYQATDQIREVPLKRYRYIGKERDEESGLEFHGARYYAVWLGRWVSSDPLGIADGINLYLYARGNPITLIDDSGNQSKPAKFVDTKAQLMRLIEDLGGPSLDITKYSEAELQKEVYRLQEISFTAKPKDKPDKVEESSDKNMSRRHRTIEYRSGEGDPLGLNPLSKTRTEVYATPEGADEMALQGAQDLANRTYTAAIAGVAQMGATRSSNQAAGAPVPEARLKQSGAPVDNTPAPKQTPKPPLIENPIPQGERVLTLEEQFDDRVRVSENGRPETYTGNLQPGQTGGTKPSTTAQKKVQTATADLNSEYHAGHMRARESGGKGGLANTFNQIGKINSGAFRVFEARLRQLVNSSNNDTLLYSLKFHYSSSTSTVPDYITARVRINGTTMRAYFSNTDSYIEEIGKMTFTKPN
jgi:RHS repeat-associated protein